MQELVITPSTIVLVLLIIAGMVLAIRRMVRKGLCDCHDGCSGCEKSKGCKECADAGTCKSSGAKGLCPSAEAMVKRMDAMKQ